LSARLPDVASVKRETLPETGPPIGAAAHFKEVERGAQPEENSEQYIVSKSHPI
jgi:hypothetical protein